MPTDPRPLGAAQPIMEGIQNAGHAIAHPIESLRKMLGMDPSQAPPVAPQGPTMVDEANESFRHPMAIPPNPVVAPPRRKSMGQM